MKYILSLASILFLLSACQPQADHLTILHTNDTHSQILPNGKGLGGYARRMGVIRSEREKDPNLLLLDAGDFSQGTAYFNFFHGRVEIDALNRMRYDAGTLGNHEFDNGIDTLAMILKLAKYPIVCANYDVTNTVLEGLVKPYTIIRRAGLKIGIFGIGVYPFTTIAEKNFGAIRYLEPYPVAQQMADTLRAQGCDVVICLSHQGTYAENPGDYNDADMCEATHGIDVIIGGHTHKIYLDERHLNSEGKEVILAQMGKSGAMLGKITLALEQD